MMKRKVTLLAIGMATILSLGGCLVKEEPTKPANNQGKETALPTKTKAQAEEETNETKEVDEAIEAKNREIFEKRMADFIELYPHLKTQKLITSVDEVPEDLKETYVFAKTFYSDFRGETKPRLPIITIEDNRVVVYGKIIGSDLWERGNLLEDLSKLTVRGSFEWLSLDKARTSIDLRGLIVHGTLSIEGGFSMTDIVSFKGLQVGGIYISHTKLKSLPDLRDITFIDSIYLETTIPEHKIMQRRLTPYIGFKKCLLEEVQDLSFLEFLEGESVRIAFPSNKIKTMPKLPDNTHLSVVQFADNELTALDNLSNLQASVLNFEGNKLESLPPIINSEIGMLIISHNKLSNLPEMENTTIETLEVSNNRIRELPDLDHIGVHAMDISENYIREANLDGYNMRELKMSKNLVTKLIVSNSTFQTLCLDRNAITDVVIANSEIAELGIRRNVVENFKASDSKIRGLYFIGSPMSGKIDVPDELRKIIEKELSSNRFFE